MSALAEPVHDLSEIGGPFEGDADERKPALLQRARVPFRLGALQGAKEQKKWGIGVDTDQGFLGNHVLTSATKKVDVGVFNTIKLAKSKAWKGGVDTLFNVKNKGVGYGQVSKTAPNRAALLGKLRLWERNLASGKVKPPRTVK